MLKKGAIFVAVAMLLMFSGKNCYASTDWIVNVLDTANGILKNVTEKYEQFTTKAQQFVSNKVGKLGDGNKGAKMKQKLQALKERFAEMEEHRKRLKARHEEGIKREQARINKFKTLVKSFKDQVKDKGQEIKDKRQEIKDKVKDKVQEIKDKVENVKDKVEGLQAPTLEGVLP